MPINYEDLMQAKSVGNTTSYGDRETMLYALGIGFMRDPMSKDELKFVYENDLQTVPTMATVIGWGNNFSDDLGTGWRSSFEPSPQPALLLGNVTSVVSGGHSSYAPARIVRTPNTGAMRPPGAA